MKQTPLEVKISEIIRPLAVEMGLELFCVQIVGGNGPRTVQIMAENPATKRISLDQCAALSRSASVALDVEDPIDGAYRLEVSSPGIDRLLLREQDFEEYKGFEARLETDMPLENGQKRFKGILKGIEDGLVAIEVDGVESKVPFAMLRKAKLVLTDALIKAMAAGQGSQEEEGK